MAKTKLLPEQKSCECSKCQNACMYKPGWFMPGEAEKAAKLLKMTFWDFFEQYLGIDWWNGKEYGQETFVLSPALADGPSGALFPQNPQGRCIFYEGTECIIHKAKPYECQMFWHGDKEGRERHKQVAMAWKPHQKRIEELLGRKPVAPEPTIFDALQMLGAMIRR